MGVYRWPHWKASWAKKSPLPMAWLARLFIQADNKIGIDILAAGEDGPIEGPPPSPLGHEIDLGCLFFCSKSLGKPSPRAPILKQRNHRSRWSDSWFRLARQQKSPGFETSRQQKAPTLIGKKPRNLREVPPFTKNEFFLIFSPRRPVLSGSAFIGSYLRTRDSSTKGSPAPPPVFCDFQGAWAGAPSQADFFFIFHDAGNFSLRRHLCLS